MKRIVLWFMSTLTVVTLLFGYHTSVSPDSPTAVVAAPAPGSTTGAGPTGSPGSSGSTGSAGSADSAGPLTVTGSSASTRWGPVQVRLTVDGGTITDVSVVRYPTGNGKDHQINARAIPILVKETLDAQSADIDMVSGATVTSEGYVESLQAALDEAGL